MHAPAAYIPFGRDEVAQSIPTRFEQQAALHARRIAIRTRSEAVDYDSLNRAANRAARAIRACNPQADVPVAVLLEQGAPQLVAMLGVLKAAHFYVALDPANPPARNVAMLEDSGARLIVTNAANLALAGTLATDGVAILDIDAIDPQVDDSNLALAIAPDALAYILYTSGSTGRPKGVMHTHQNVLHNVMRHTGAFHITAEDRQTLLYTASVYGGQRDIYNALLNGAALIAFPVKDEGVAGLAQWLRQERVTIYCSVATVFRHFIDALDPAETFPDIRLIKLGGEASHKRDIESYRAHFPPPCVVHCGLGSTETGVVRHYFVDHATPLESARIPLGYPVEDMELLLLGEDGRPVAQGEVGEIAIRSRYVALGYWRRPDATQAVFERDPVEADVRIYHTGDLGQLRADGCLEHRGRRDFQVKVRGNRVETVEVEMALLGLSSVKSVAVVVRKDQQGDDYLAAYMVAAVRPAPTVSALRTALARALPDFMVPSVFVFLEALPLLPNGKVDRQNLPEPDHTRPQLAQAYVAPRTELERELATLWGEVLGLDRIGIADNFFELGGHSLIAVRMMNAIRERYGRSLALATLFSAGTVEALARVIEDTERPDTWSPLVAIRPQGRQPPLFFVHPAGGNVLGYSEFAGFLEPDQPFYGLQAYGIVDGQQPHDCIETMASIYLAAMREVQPAGPYYLGGESFGGIVAFEIAQQLHAAGEHVALLIIGDAWIVHGPHFRPWRYRMSGVTWPFAVPPADWMDLVRRKVFERNRERVKRYTFADEIHRRLVLAHRVARKNYQARSYPGRVTLFRATRAGRKVRRLEHYFGGRHMGWEWLAQGGAEVHLLSDIHREILHGDNAAQFARLLTDCLQRARDTI